MLRTTRFCSCGLLLLLLFAVASCGGGSGASAEPSVAPSAGGPQRPAPAASRASAASAPVRLRVPAGNGGGPFSSARSLTIPRGWKAEVWARVAKARSMLWTPQHTLLVSVPSAGTVVELRPGATPSARPHQHVLLSGLSAPQGLAFDTFAGQPVLYVAESNEIDRYPWLGGAGVGARTVAVPNLRDLDPHGTDVHGLKSLAVGSDHRLYLNIGSAFNANPHDLRGNPPRASIVSYAPDGGGLRVIATGVRNGEGLSFAPDGRLWTAINERDNIAYPFHQPFGGISDAYGHVIQTYVNDHPPDELVALTPGRNVGWPYCNPDPGHGMANMRFDADVQTNPHGARLRCGSIPPINRGIPAHSAPLGFHFLQGSALPRRFAGGAVVAAHGSWDRVPPRPPAVLWLPWSRSRHTLGAAVTLVSGFQYANGSRWGRPADAVPGPDGALYVSDDTAGAIYRIAP